MNIPGVVAAFAGLALLSGCGIALTSDHLPPRAPDVTIGADRPHRLPPGSSSATSAVALPPGCEVPRTSLVEKALGAIEDGYALGWTAAAQVGDVLAIQRPVYAGLQPTGTTVATVAVLPDGSLGTATNPGRKGVAVACVEGITLPPQPDLTCQHADLEELRLRQEQTGPAVTAYGSEIVDSAQVDVGDGYVIVAARLSAPTGPGGADAAAWLWTPDTGWVAEVSDGWRGGGANHHRALPWGQMARDAALGCID